MSEVGYGSAFLNRLRLSGGTDAKKSLPNRIFFWGLTGPESPQTGSKLTISRHHGLLYVRYSKGRCRAERFSVPRCIVRASHIRTAPAGTSGTIEDADSSH